MVWNRISVKFAATGLLVLSAGVAVDPNQCSAQAVSSFMDQVTASPPVPTSLGVAKAENGFYQVSGDNGWVVYGNINNGPTVSMKNVPADLGSFSGNGNPVGTSQVKLSVPSVFGPAGGSFFTASGITFVPSAASTRPASPSGTTLSQYGIGLSWGTAYLNNGGIGGCGPTGATNCSTGGWWSDINAVAQVTNTVGALGSIYGLATNATCAATDSNGYCTMFNTPSFAVAVGVDWASGGPLAFIQPLDAGTFDASGAPITPSNPFGNFFTKALGVSRNAEYVVGEIADSKGANHAAVYQIGGGATAWTDITASTGWPTSVSQSLATNASNDGFVTGRLTVKTKVGAKSVLSQEAFVYTVATNSATVFASPTAGFDVIPMAVLPGTGDVTGALKMVDGRTEAPVYHTFLFNGTSVTDFGVMNVAGSSTPAWSCAPMGANDLGEVVGGCVQFSNQFWSHQQFGAFYINTLASTPAFVDVNATVHARLNNECPPPSPGYYGCPVQDYVFYNATGIDDQDYISLMGDRVIGGITGSLSNFDGFILTPAGYR